METPTWNFYESNFAKGQCKTSDMYKDESSPSLFALIKLEESLPQRHCQLPIHGDAGETLEDDVFSSIEAIAMPELA